MLRKIVRIGASLGVIIPKEALKEQNLRIGDNVDVSLSKSAARRGRQDRIDPHVLQLTHECMEEYHGLLKKLADA